MPTELGWAGEKILVTLQQKRQCHECFYSIEEGSYALKFYGSFYHYPSCPKRTGRKVK